MNTKYETVADIIAERDSLRIDAERYRWLRSNHPIHDNSPFICRNFGASFSQWTEEQADAAIDDAMTRTPNIEGNRPPAGSLNRRDEHAD